MGCTGILGRRNLIGVALLAFFQYEDTQNPLSTGYQLEYPQLRLLNSSRKSHAVESFGKHFQQYPWFQSVAIRLADR
jgi:hypothetical protein